MAIQPTGSLTPPPLPTSPDGTAVSAAPKTAAPVQTSEAVHQAAAVPTMEQLAAAVKNINDSLQQHARGLEFAVDSESERVVVKIIDQDTKQVLRQIPSEEALELAKALDQAQQGMLIRQKA